MFLIHCPHCGERRAEEEFHAVGEAHILRPADPAACSDTEWGDYLYFRDNPRGEYREMWVHAAGCRKHFNLARDTMSYAILGSYRIGETFEAPAGSSGGGAGWQEVGASVAAAETAPARAAQVGGEASGSSASGSKAAGTKAAGPKAAGSDESAAASNGRSPSSGAQSSRASSSRGPAA